MRSLRVGITGMDDRSLRLWADYLDVRLDPPIALQTLFQLELSIQAGV
jgi:hypothetical protein